MTIFFTLGVCAAFAAIALLKVRKWTFTRNDQKLRVQDIGLLRRQRTDYTFDADSHAEMVISRSNDIEDGNLFNAVFVSQQDGTTQEIVLDNISSFKMPSARIVIAVNAWLRADDTAPQHAKAQAS